ncbi:hypothetical protein BE221DRAFT_65811 [Ostreococcus tauri]|uniref:Uncharacterized protein n=1 Tax=Ostreococcus tauri TaxID=70448 RepID=A0A1Y5INI7_OSTTA|nr:hypothetical protein BE221DRAFT_65811 [Ostreococcus tauri]
MSKASTRPNVRRHGGVVHARCVATRALNEDDIAFLTSEFPEWIKDAEGARKSDAYFREKHNRAFNLEKARVVVKSLRDEHAKLPAASGPYASPKTFPGFLGVYERCSDEI